jgi:DNA-binding response OmpR family regulator
MKLTAEGFDVAKAADGEEGLKILENRNFDLILLDLMMPKVDGFAFLSELKLRRIKTPVVVATNLDQADSVARVFELGCSSYYIKSDTTLEQIAETVKNTLR